MSKATQVDIINTIVQKSDFNKSQAKEVYQLVVSSIQECFEQNRGVSCVGLGTFKRVEVPGRWHRNPQNGDRVYKDAHEVVKYKPSPRMKKTLASSPSS